MTESSSASSSVAANAGEVKNAREGVCRLVARDALFFEWLDGKAGRTDGAGGVDKENKESI